MAPVRPPAGSQTQIPKRKPASLLVQGRDLLLALLFDRAYFLHLTGLLLIGELALGLLIIRDIPYTKIDWDAYMQHVECFLNGERNYSKLQGETGPAVYPALFLYAYTALYKILPSDPDSRVRAAQYVFLAIYLATLAFVAGIYHSAGSSTPARTRNIESLPTKDQSWIQSISSKSTYPQALLIPLCLSKRLHSIYMLRLFNDPIAMLILYAAVFAMTRRTAMGWGIGVGLYSFALGVKMNILLFLPGLLVLLVQYRGILKTIEAVFIMAVVQIWLPAAYFLNSRSDAVAYFTTAFDFSRQFLYKWTVNWRFVPEDVFLSAGFAKCLLGTHILLLVLFALFKWSPVPGGTKTVLLNAISSPSRPAAPKIYSLPRSHVPLVLFTSNLIGIALARSLHYQFHSWYFHQIPFMLYAGGAWHNPLLGMTLWLAIEYGWATYPSTNLSSGLLSIAHIIMLLRLLFASTPTPTSVPLSADEAAEEIETTRAREMIDVDSRKVR